MKKLIIISSFILVYCNSIAQVNINRYAERKISLKGISGSKTIDKEIIIPEIDIHKVSENWQNNKMVKFAEPVLVDISPFEQGLWERDGNYMINRLKITANKAMSRPKIGLHIKV